MKRLIALFTLLSLLTIVSSISAQNGITFKVTYNNNSDSRSYASKDIKEFHAFRKDIDRFSNAVHRDKVRKSRRIKNDILRRMRNEISDTQKKIRYTKWEIDQSYDKGLHQKNRRNNGYSKRSGSKKVWNLKELRTLNKQLDIQNRIVFRLERMHLDNGRDFFEQAQYHKLLMRDFEATLKADIDSSFREYRTRNRRGN